MSQSIEIVSPAASIVTSRRRQGEPVAIRNFHDVNAVTSAVHRSGQHEMQALCMLLMSSPCSSCYTAACQAKSAVGLLWQTSLLGLERPCILLTHQLLPRGDLMVLGFHWVMADFAVTCS